MLWRYVGVTLVALGGAMLIAPDAEEEQSSSASQTTRQPGSDAGAVAHREADRETQTLLPDAHEFVAGRDGTERAEDDAARLARLDPVLSDAAALPGEGAGPASLTDEQVVTAPGEANLPSLARPESLRPADITAETLALIERTEETWAAASAGAVAEEPDRFFVSGNRVNVRSGPSTSYAVIGSTVYGEAVELLAFENDSWAWVRFGDDREGYMARSFLAPDLGDG